MPLSEEQQAIVDTLETKKAELEQLENLLKTTKSIDMINSQSAPSPKLERQGKVYFSELLVLHEKSKELQQKIAAALSARQNDQPVDAAQLSEIITLSAQIKDEKRNAFGNLVAFKTNDTYEKMRKKIGKEKAAQIAQLLEGADSLIGAFGKVSSLKMEVDKALSEVNLQRAERNLNKAKQELIETERSFKIDMATLSQADTIYQMNQKLSEKYPRLAALIKMSTAMHLTAKKLHKVFETASQDPSILNKPETQKLLQDCFAQLGAASALKNLVDQHEIEGFNNDTSPDITALKQNFLTLDQRGLYSYLGMPFQRIGRYAITLKEAVNAISQIDQETGVVSCIDTKFSNDWRQFNEALTNVQTLAKQANERVQPARQSSAPVVMSSKPTSVSQVIWQTRNPSSQAPREDGLLSKRGGAAVRGTEEQTPTPPRSPAMLPSKPWKSGMTRERENSDPDRGAQIGNKRGLSPASRQAVDDGRPSGKERRVSERGQPERENIPRSRSNTRKK